MSFPDNCLKGIPNDEFLTEEGDATSHLFSFESKNNRDDGWCEQSINWEDDKHAINFTLSQMKNGDIQFKSGLVIIPRNELDRLNKNPTVNGLLSYERKELNDNKYHGNLLLKTNTSKSKRRMISAGIALLQAKRIKQSTQ